MSDNWFITVLTYFPMVEALPFFFFTYVVAVFRMRKTMSSNDLSIIGHAFTMLVNVIYVLYGIFIIGQWPYIVSYSLATIGNVGVFVTILWYRQSKYVNKEQRSKVVCEKCGKIFNINRGQKYCPYCGRNVEKR